MENSHRKQSGFTLIEISFAIMFFGLFAGLFLNSFITYQEETQQATTQENIDFGQTAISNFYAVNGRYPCPARLSAGPDDADYGLEDCTGGSLDADFTASPNGQFVDLDNDGVAEKVMAGAIPFNTIAQSLGDADDSIIGLGYESYFGKLRDHPTESMTLDAYGNKLTYVVTAALADPGNFGKTPGVFDPKRGAVLVIDEHRTTPVDFDYASDHLADERLVHFAVISHGPDGKGAYTKEGNVVETCISGTTLPPGPPPPGPPITTYADQTENCDAASAAELNGAVISGLRNSVSGSEYDDTIFTWSFSNTDVWSMVDTDKITALPEGNVGIGTSNPGEKLEVTGGNMQSDSIKAQQYCDAEGGNCMDASTIAGELTDMQCPKSTDPPTYKIITGISHNKVTCGLPNIAATPLAKCAAGQFMTGIRVSSGVTTPICKTP